jgi:hypothetical protein
MKALPQLFVRRYDDINDPNAWVLLDLYDTDPIKMNLRAQDVMDPTITAASYSQTFRIPHSSANGKFFKQAFNVNQTLFDPAVKVQAYINNEGQLWMTGIIQLMNVYRADATSKIEYEILFISEVSDFATQIGLSPAGATGENQGGFLTDLNLGKYDHELNYNNIILSWKQGFGGTGGREGDIVYPLCEWGYNYTGSGVSSVPTIPTMATTGSAGSTGSKPFCNPNFPLFQGQMKPALRLKAVWDAIFERTEYTYESEYIQGVDWMGPTGATGVSKYADEFKDLYIISDKFARATLYESGFTGSTGTTGGSVENVNARLVANRFYQYTNYAQRIGYLFPAFDFANNFNVGTQVFTISVPGTYEFTFTAGYDWDPNYTPTGSEVFIFSLSTVGGGSSYASGVDFFTYSSLSGNITASAVFTFAAGDTIQFYGNVVGVPFGSASVEFYDLKINTTQTPQGLFNVKTILPDNIKQIDFIRSINERWKFVWEPSKTKPKHFIITPWTDWIRQGTTKDWTDKLNDKKDYKLTPLFQSQPRFVTYKDQEDSDYVNYNYQQAKKQIYGQLNLDSGIEIIKGTKDVQGIFATLPLAPIGYGAGASSQDVLAAETFLIPHIAKNTPVNDGPTKREPIQPKLRLAWYNQLCGASGPGTNVSKSWYLQDDTGAAIEQTKVPLMSSYYPNPWTKNNFLLDWNNSTVNWDTSLPGNPSGDTIPTVFERFWGDWYDATYGQIITVTGTDGKPQQIKDYAYIFEGEFVLDYSDIVDLRFNDKIWIKDAYYLVNSINDYVIGEASACKVVLYKISNIDLAISAPNQIVDGICYSSESICNAVCCQEFSPITAVFVADPDNIVVGTRFFLNPSGSIFAPAGYYSDGTLVYTVSSNSVVTVIDTIDVSPALCVCIPELDPLELCYYGATGDACLACCCQGATGEFWMQDNNPATWYNNTVFYANSTGSAFPPNGWYAYDNTNYVFINNGLRTQSGSCSICNCLIYDLTSYVGCTGATLCEASCCVNATNYNFFADSDDLNTATVLFSNQSGTPVPNGWYYNGLAAVSVTGGTGSVNATGDPGSCEPCANETLDVFFDFNSNVNGTGAFAITRSFDGISYMPESTKDLVTIPANTPFNYTGPISPGTYVKGTLVYGASHDTGTFATKLEGGATINSQGTVRFSTYTYAPTSPSTGGTEYRFSVNLTGTIYDCGLSGGTAWKCTTPSCNITGGTGGNSVYVYDNNIEVCCDPLYIYDAGVARIDEDTQVFINGNCTGGTGGFCYECNDFVSGTYAGNDYHIYENYFICNDLDAGNITFNWVALDRPNRFSLYNSTGLLATSGWVGTATYPGPWGASLSTPNSGALGVPYTNDMYLLVEAGPASPSSPISDAWQGTFVCSTSCFQYFNYQTFDWVGDWEDCDGINHSAETIPPYGSVCAIYGTPFTISGTDLTQTFPCSS